MKANTVNSLHKQKVASMFTFLRAKKKIDSIDWE